MDVMIYHPLKYFKCLMCYSVKLLKILKSKLDLGNIFKQSA